MVLSSRRLFFPLNRSEIIEALVTDESSLLLTLDSIFPTDPDEKTDVVINLSLNEYVSLATSVDVGRDIAYADGEIDIWWLWSRILVSNFCEKMIDCINENDAVRQAIINALNDGVPVSGDAGVNESIAGSNLLAGVTCDNDSLFGATTGLVDLINNIATDLIEQISASANVTGRIGDMIESIPVVGVLPFDDALQMVETFLDDLSQNYDASYTVALRDDYRCALFCIAQEDCTITFEQIFDYFVGELGQSVTTLDVEDFLEFFTQGTFAGVEIVHAFHAFVSGLMLFGASVTGIDQKRMFNIFQTMFNDPDSDWSTLCDCGWEHTFDFTVENDAWTAVESGGNERGQYIGSTGWSTTDIPVGGNYRRGLFVSRVFTETTITKVEMTFDLTKGSPTIGEHACYGIYHYLSGALQSADTVFFDDATNGDDKVFTYTLTDSLDEIRILETASSWASAVYSGSALLTKVKVWGDGDNPFV